MNRKLKYPQQASVPKISFCLSLVCLHFHERKKINKQKEAPLIEEIQGEEKRPTF
jgi:hypothetical protein